MPVGWVYLDANGFPVANEVAQTFSSYPKGPKGKGKGKAPKGYDPLEYASVFAKGFNGKEAAGEFKPPATDTQPDEHTPEVMQKRLTQQEFTIPIKALEELTPHTDAIILLDKNEIPEATARVKGTTKDIRFITDAAIYKHKSYTIDVAMQTKDINDDQWRLGIKPMWVTYMGKPGEKMGTTPLNKLSGTTDYHGTNTTVRVDLLASHYTPLQGDANGQLRASDLIEYIDTVFNVQVEPDSIKTRQTYGDFVLELAAEKARRLLQISGTRRAGVSFREQGTTGTTDEEALYRLPLLGGLSYEEAADLLESNELKGLHCGIEWRRNKEAYRFTIRFTTHERMVAAANALGDPYTTRVGCQRFTIEAFPKSVNEQDVEHMLRNAGWKVTEMLSWEYMGKRVKSRKTFTALATQKPPASWKLMLAGVEPDVWTTACKRVNEKEGIAQHNALIRRIGVYGLPATESADFLGPLHF